VPMSGGGTPPLQSFTRVTDRPAARIGPDKVTFQGDLERRAHVNLDSISGL
jgi:hypothetical protein